ncbi:S-layer homology domain-containing protein [Falsibacillus pallidus]|uniref:S-layer homology domain-containing protein n=1 Tax=Falsibacillus pallidus TaxID=493781 RepID=UPI003D95F7BF
MRGKILISIFLAAFMFLCFQITTNAKSHEGVKIGVAVSALSESYPFIERPGGTYEGTSVLPKGLSSSIKNKRIKTKILLEQLGYDVTYIYDEQLKDAKKLQEYDSIFFPNTVMMSSEERAAVKEYIKDGGGAFFGYGFARNDSARYPYKATDLDRTAVIYDTHSWVYEWDNASEMIQSAFINDVVVYAIEYGKGKAVWIGFQPLDYINIPNDQSEEWETFDTKGHKQVRGDSWDGLVGGEDLKAFIDEAVAWTAEHKEKYLPIDQSNSISLTEVSAYPRANDYVVYGTMTTHNTGNVVSRGTMVAEILDPSGKVVRTYSKYVVGLTPGQSSYAEKVYFTLPKNLAAGNYILRATYHSGKEGTAQLVLTGDQVQLQIAKADQKGQILPLRFKDIPSSFWANKDIYELYSSGLISGYKNGNFGPQNNITRLQAAMILTRALHLKAESRPDPGLRDVKKGQYGYDVISTVVDEGIFSGSNGKFNPDKLLTREQMAKILVNAFALTGEEKISFSDVPKGSWSESFISTLLANDVTQVQGSFRPSEYTNRAQFAAFVHRAMSASIQ